MILNKELARKLYKIGQIFHDWYQLALIRRHKVFENPNHIVRQILLKPRLPVDSIYLADKLSKGMPVLERIFDMQEMVHQYLSTLFNRAILFEQYRCRVLIDR